MIMVKKKSPGLWRELLALWWAALLGCGGGEEIHLYPPGDATARDSDANLQDPDANSEPDRGSVSFRATEVFVQGASLGAVTAVSPLQPDGNAPRALIGTTNLNTERVSFWRVHNNSYDGVEQNTSWSGNSCESSAKKLLQVASIGLTNHQSGLSVLRTTCGGIASTALPSNAVYWRDRQNQYQNITDSITRSPDGSQGLTPTQWLVSDVSCRSRQCAMPWYALVSTESIDRWVMLLTVVDVMTGKPNARLMQPISESTEKFMRTDLAIAPTGSGYLVYMRAPALRDGAVWSYHFIDNETSPAANEHADFAAISKHVEGGPVLVIATPKDTERPKELWQFNGEKFDTVTNVGSMQEVSFITRVTLPDGSDALLTVANGASDGSFIRMSCDPAQRHPTCVDSWRTIPVVWRNGTPSNVRIHDAATDGTRLWVVGESGEQGNPLPLVLVVEPI